MLSISAIITTLCFVSPHYSYSVKPLGDFGEEVKQVMQTGGVSGRQQTGQQLEGRGPVLQAGQRLGFEQSGVELRGKQRLWQLPAELFDERCHVVGESCG